MAKKKSKLKKIGAALAAGLGAAALMRGKNKPKPLTPKYMGGNTTGDANIAENIANFNKGMDNMATMTDDGRSGVSQLKKGGRVGVGIAKRGFGRAMKGKK